jgi:peptidoglycan hydrolase CwlO-like protein
MSTTNYPSASDSTTPRKDPNRKEYKGAVIGILAVALLGTWGYLLYDKNKTSETIQTQQTQIEKITDDKSEIQKNFDASLARLDSLTGYNNELEGKLTSSNSEISKLKNEIRTILNKRNATTAELKRAQNLVNELNTKISGLEEEVARLTGENQQLTVEKTQLTADKEQLTKNLDSTVGVSQTQAKTIDVASTLYASNISITPVNEKSGGKEKVTTTAKRVDKLVINFDVDNRIAQTGQTDVYVSITGPDGKPITVEALGSGTFTTREEGEKFYTAKVSVDMEAGKRKPVQFAWKPNSNFQTGNYKIEIYHNGYKIGEGTRSLKKGGLFS